MTPKQLELLLDYISNEIQIQALRGSGRSWREQHTLRNSFLKQLRASVSETKTSFTEDTPPPHYSDNKFSPLMVEMLLFAYHSGHRFNEFPNFNYLAQQEAYKYFILNDYLTTQARTSSPNVVFLTEKGKALVNKILNTSLH